VWIAVISLLALVRHYRQSLWGALATLLTLIVAIAGAFALRALALARSGGASWVSDPRPVVAAMWLIGIAAAIACAALFAKRGILFPGVAVVWHLLAIVVAITLPGAAFLFLVPAVVLTICILLRASETVTAIAASLAGTLGFFPLGALLYEALGPIALLVIALLLALEGTLLAAAIPRWRYAGAFAMLAVACALISLTRPRTRTNIRKRFRSRTSMIRRRNGKRLPSRRSCNRWRRSRGRTSSWRCGTATAQSSPHPRHDYQFREWSLRRSAREIG
jgi:hypothetical protein